MGYYLQAVIARQNVLEAHTGDFSSVALVPLACNLGLVPLTDELFDEIGATVDSGRFYKLTPAVIAWAQAISAAGPVAYVEADFFGGTGGQGAVAWERGSELLSPTHSAEAINQALRLLGVRRSALHDEFDMVGLPRHRDTSEWLDSAVPNIRTA